MKLKPIYQALWMSVIVGVAGCDSEDSPAETTVTEPVAEHVYPAPGGQYQVGVKAIDILDAGPDGMSPVPNETRRLPIKVFYPTEENTGTYRNYFDSWGHQVAFLEKNRPQGAPIHPNQFDLQGIQSWSQGDVAIAKATSGQGWPILFYSHGALLFEVDNTELLEDLASRGYVVVSINHPYIAGAASFQDGSVVNVYLPEGTSNVRTEKGSAYFNEVVAPQITHDVTYVYQWLSWHQEVFDYQLDDTRIGTLGFSLGGSAAMNSCAQIAACVASANMDGLLLGDIRYQPLNKPLLLLQTPEQELSEAFADNGHDTFLFTIQKTTHQDFMDQNRWVLGYPSQVDIDQIHAIKKQSMATFFDHYLKGETVLWPEYDGLTLAEK
ncbi:hypothetical protein [Photobacterium sp. 1_MG-2023]|uniref:hypothetical protein n=1 Tax=Photobacterium sp. 1_MG-2023 TaxID=3062646 RepID=UPI0026E3ADBC|nr:hypothetical protein [Photobacterium sp. 1_MG-2023]MDO6708141.1 hypothetical protein [Photobacterium sp. 1_MG-2023]